jgi:hypothetical protein
MLAGNVNQMQEIRLNEDLLLKICVICVNTHVPLWMQQHMVDRHYSLNLKPWSARTLFVYAHAFLAQKYSVGLQETIVSRLCSQEENYFFPLVGQEGLQAF